MEYFKESYEKANEIYVENIYLCYHVQQEIRTLNGWCVPNGLNRQQISYSIFDTDYSLSATDFFYFFIRTTDYTL